MIPQLPIYIIVIFILTFACALIFFLRATHFSLKITLLFFLWVCVQAILAYSQFYLNTSSLPPRILLALLPPFFIIGYIFLTAKGKLFLNRLNIKTLTIIHIIRVPIEIVLYLLYIHKAAPELMTFSGRNFDILAGLSAPIVYYFGFIKKVLNSKVILLWNIICLVLLINIIVNAVLSVPFPFQQFGYDQPNIALLHFPFVWLPSVIVPIILFSHLVSIIQILKKTEWKENKA
jgi:hypothetical protein